MVFLCFQRKRDFFRFSPILTLEVTQIDFFHESRSGYVFSTLKSTYGTQEYIGRQKTRLSGRFPKNIKKGFFFLRSKKGFFSYRHLENSTTTVTRSDEQ